jgi:hypothetical protein
MHRVTMLTPNAVQPTNKGAQAMTNEEVLKVIEEAKASGATELDLSWKNLNALPPEIGQLRKLQQLIL